MYRMKKKIHFFNATDLLCFTIFIIYNEYTEKNIKKKKRIMEKNKDKRRKSIFLFKKMRFFYFK